MAPQRIGSHYLLHEQIGQGGMGAVWRAEDTDTEIRRAVKVLKPEYARDPGAVARFVRERNALVALRHPNVVTLHDMLVEGERLALVMDLLTEGDLDKFRRDHGGKVPPPLAAELVAQVCDGLAAAHALGIVHRDLKPGNVLMESGHARLTDFGIARIGGETSVTTAGMVLGTVCYMAPEALNGAEPAPACDVYAAGVTLYELLAGRPPFTGQPAVIITGHLHTVPPRPDGIPDPLWRLIAACLDKDPARRPTAAQLAAALRRPEITAGARPVQPASQAQPGSPVQPDNPAQTGDPWEPGPWESGSRWQQPASQWGQPASPVRRETTKPFEPEAKPQTVTGIGWLSPVGPVSPPAFENQAAHPSPPAPPGNLPLPTNANNEASGKRRRTWLIAAAALILVAAGAGAATALSGGTSTPQANSATSSATTGPASLADTGQSADPSQPVSPTASQRTSEAASPVATTSAATSPSPTATTPVTTSPATTPAATAPATTPAPSPSTVTVTATATTSISLAGKTVTSLRVTELNAATKGSNGSVQVTWNQVDGATSYKVYMEVKGSFTTDRTLANEGGLAAGNHQIQITPEPGGAPISIAFVIPK